jgi:hypothetical protein
MTKLSPAAEAVMVAAFDQDHPNAHHVLAPAPLDLTGNALLQELFGYLQEGGQLK